jgi:hypothetical protein
VEKLAGPRSPIGADCRAPKHLRIAEMPKAPDSQSLPAYPSDALASVGNRIVSGRTGMTRRYLR